jgi:hypothetical protein
MKLNSFALQYENTAITIVYKKVVAVISWKGWVANAAEQLATLACHADEASTTIQTTAFRSRDYHPMRATLQNRISVAAEASSDESVVEGGQDLRSFCRQMDPFISCCRIPDWPLFDITEHIDPAT